jgi:hypothetical protein
MFNFEQFSRPKLFYAARYGGEENRAQQLPFHSSAGWGREAFACRATLPRHDSDPEGGIVWI